MWTAAQVSPLALASRSSSVPRGSPTSPGVVPTAEQRGNSNVVVRVVAGIATAINGRGKCILLFAPLVAKTPRYLSSPETGDRCTAATATLQSGADPTFWVGQHEKKRVATFMLPSFSSRSASRRFVASLNKKLLLAWPLTFWTLVTYERPRETPSFRKRQILRQLLVQKS